jgi:hypothetical protein
MFNDAFPSSCERGVDGLLSGDQLAWIVSEMTMHALTPTAGGPVHLQSDGRRPSQRAGPVVLSKDNLDAVAAMVEVGNTGAETRIFWGGRPHL